VLKHHEILTVQPVVIFLILVVFVAFRKNSNSLLVLGHGLDLGCIQSFLLEPLRFTAFANDFFVNVTSAITCTMPLIG